MERERPQAAQAADRDDRTALDLRVVGSTAGLDLLREAWTALQERTNASVFQSWEWQRAWWAHFGETGARKRLHVVVVSEGGEIVAIAPFVIEEVPIAPFARLRRLAFLGSGMTDHLDLLARGDRAGASCARIAAHLSQQRRAFDVLSLSDIPDGSAVRPLLYEQLRAHGFAGSMFVVEQCPRTLLKASWAEMLESFDAGRRKQIAKRLRLAKERFQVELEVTTDPARLEQDVDEFIALHQRRWTSQGKKGVFAEEKTAAFQRQVARAFFARGWLFLAFLRMNGERVAAMCCFRQGSEVAYYLGGIADAGEALKYSPGMVLHYLCMEALIGQGARVYDFLRGPEKYKYELGAVDVPNWAMLMFREGARAARAKSRVALLEESLGRRLEQERLAFGHQRKVHGLLSAAMARYLWGRASATWRDGIKKLRAPEKSLTARE